MAVMSTTSEFKVAQKYAESECPLVFKFNTVGLTRNIPVLSNVKKRKEKRLKNKDSIFFSHSRLIPVCGRINHSPPYLLGSHH